MGAIHLFVSGMTCASCVSTVETASSAVPGVIDARVNPAANTANVDTAYEVPASVLTEAVASARYQAKAIEEDVDSSDTERVESERRYRLLMRKSARHCGCDMRSTERLASGPTGLFWIWVGVVVMTAGAIALFRLDGSIPRVIIGIALAVCIGMVMMMLWFDRRVEHETERPGGRTAAAEEESEWHSQHTD